MVPSNQMAITQLLLVLPYNANRLRWRSFTVFVDYSVNAKLNIFILEF